MRSTQSAPRGTAITSVTISSVPSAMSTPQKSQSRPQSTPSALTTWLIFLALFFTVYFASLFTPPLLDDVDASHAQTAQHIIDSGNWVTTQTNGIRYIEKPPLPFWLVAIAYKLFGENAFATHLPNALAILGLTWLAWLWARRAWDDRAGLYAGLAILTSVGPFLFTRFIIPEIASSASYSSSRSTPCSPSLEDNKPARFYWAWAALALAAAHQGPHRPRLLLWRSHPLPLALRPGRRWRELKPFTGIAALPRHRRALAHPRRPRQSRRGPSRRQHSHPRQRARLLVLLFHQRACPALLRQALSARLQQAPRRSPTGSSTSSGSFPGASSSPRSSPSPGRPAAPGSRSSAQLRPPRLPTRLHPPSKPRFRVRTIWLLSLFSAFSLLFFSISTNQEYYTFPVWPPLLILIAGVLATTEERASNDRTPSQISIAWITNAQAVFAIIGILVAAALGWGLWDSRAPPLRARHRHPPRPPRRRQLHPLDVALLRPHRPILRRAPPARLARRRSLCSSARPSAGSCAAAESTSPQPSASRSPRPSSSSPRTSPSRASRPCSAPSAWPKPSCNAAPPPTPSSSWATSPTPRRSSSTPTTSSTANPPLLVLPRCGQHGEGSTLLWGSCYTDSPDIFLSDQQLVRDWGTGNRKWLFAQDPNQLKAERLFAGRLYLVQTVADKDLWTDRPLP